MAHASGHRLPCTLALAGCRPMRHNRKQEIKKMRPGLRAGRKGMRLIFVATVLSLAALTPLAADDDIVLRGMGSFHVGGRIAEVSGKPVRMIVRQPGGPLTKLDPNGQYMVEQMYVQY